jgi:hypothetical protein
MPAACKSTTIEFHSRCGNAHLMPVWPQTDLPHLCISFIPENHVDVSLVYWLHMGLAVLFIDLNL